MDQQPPQQPLPPYQPDQPQQQSPFTLPSGVPTTPPVMAPPPPARKRNILLIVLGILGGLLVLCVVGGAALAFIGNTPQAQEAARQRSTAQAATAEALKDSDAALLASADSVFDEKFSSAPDGLNLEPGEGTAAKVEGGTYVATLEKGGYRSVYSKSELTNFISEVDCKAVSGGDNGRCGIVFAVKEQGEDKDNDEYYFYVGGNEYGMSTTIDGDDTGFLHSNDAVKSDGTNHLKVIRVDGEARLYVNDTLVDTIKDDKLKSGGVGFAVSAPGGDAEVSVDNWQVWELP